MTNTSHKWEPGAAAWRQFCEQQHPELGYSGNANSWINFHRKHGKLLEERGVVRRSPARRTVIVDSGRFEPVVFDLLTLGYVPDESRAATA